MHDFLVAVHEFYDIAIWSQTSWKALEMKVTSLGILTHDEYRVNFGMYISVKFICCCL